MAITSPGISPGKGTLDYFASRKRSADSLAILCPICHENIADYGVVARNTHAEECLTAACMKEEGVEPPKICEEAGKAGKVGETDEAVKSDETGDSSVKPEESADSLYELESGFPTDEELGELSVDVGELVGDAGDIKSFPDTSPNGSVRKPRNVGKRMRKSDPKPRKSGSKSGKPWKNVVEPFKVLKLHEKSLVVDCFNRGKVENIDHYYLSHYHADHYMGLRKSWSHGYVYCSPVTARLVLQELRVEPQYVVELEMGVPHIVDGVEVTLYDANHCPGAAVFLFRYRGKTILHTGDFRACPELVKAVSGIHIDQLYLDTTYLDPSYVFPRQKQVVEVCGEYFAEFCSRNGLRGCNKQVRLIDLLPSSLKSTGKQKMLVLIGSYTIGKERLAVGIAKAMNSKIYCEWRKRRIFNAVNDPEMLNLLTGEPSEAAVHVVGMRNFSEKGLEDYYKKYDKYFTNVAGVRPSGWSFSIAGTRNEVFDPLKDTPFTRKDLERQENPSRVVQLYQVPYSEHSSFRDLHYFCTLVDIGEIISTVNTHSPRSVKLADYWFEQWEKIRQDANKVELLCNM